MSGENIFFILLILMYGWVILVAISFLVFMILDSMASSDKLKKVKHVARMIILWSLSIFCIGLGLCDLIT